MVRKSQVRQSERSLGSLVSSMVSEQIRKSEENGEDAVEAQDSGSAVGSNGSSAKTSDNKDAGSAPNQISQDARVNDEGRKLVSSTASRTRMPAIPPPPPPSGKPRSELGHKPLNVGSKKPASPPPPPPSVKNKASTVSSEPKSDGAQAWATISQEVSTFDVEDSAVKNDSEKTNSEQIEGKVESEVQEKTSKAHDPEKSSEPNVAETHSVLDGKDELSEALPVINIDVALEGLDADFNLDNSDGQWKDPLVDLDNEFKGLKLDTPPDTVPLPESPTTDTGEFKALLENAPRNELMDSTATEVEAVSEDDIDDQGPGATLKSKHDSPGPLEVTITGQARTDYDRSEVEDIEDTLIEAEAVFEAKLDIDEQIIETIEKKESSESEQDSVEDKAEVPTSPTAEEAESPKSESTKLESELKDLFPVELDDLFPNDFGGADSDSTTKSETAEPAVKPPVDKSSDENATPGSDTEAKGSERRSLSSLVAKGKTDKPSVDLSKSAEPAEEAKNDSRSDCEDGQESLKAKIDFSSESSAESASDAFEVGPRSKPEGKSKFASLLSSSLGDTVSMRDIMENDTVPEAPPPLLDFGSPNQASMIASPEVSSSPLAEPSGTTSETSKAADAAALEVPTFRPELYATLDFDSQSASLPLVASAPVADEDVSKVASTKLNYESSRDDDELEEIEDTLIEVEPVPAEPVTQEPSPLGADGLPEPWLNMGKKTSDSLQTPKFEDKSKSDSTGTTSSTRTFNTKTPRSTNDELHWVSTSDNLKKISEKDLPPGWGGLDNAGAKTVAEDKKAEEQKAEDKPESTTPGTSLSKNNTPSLGSLQRTTTESWIPAAQERSSTNWEIVPPSDLETAPAKSAQYSTGQNFSRVIHDELIHDDVLDDSLVTPQTAEAVFLKGDVTEGARQYHVLIEREESSATPNIADLVQWSEQLGDLYILMDEPASAVSFYYKARKLAQEPEPRRIQKYLSCLLKLSTRYEEEGNSQEAEKTYLEAIKVAGEELDEKDVLHQRINEAYVQHSKRKNENSSSSHTAAIEEQCTTLRMRAVQGTDKSFSPTRKPNVKEIFEETKLEKADRAERNEKIRRATGSEIEFKAAKSMEELSGHPMMRVLNSIWVQVILGVMLIMCGLTCMVSLRMTEQIAPIPVKANLIGTYKTAEMLKVVEFKKNNKVGIWDEGAISVGTYKAVHGNTDDLLELLKGYLRSKTVFYTLDSSDLLQDEDGRALYTQNAPERKIIQQMWWYTGFATWHYKEKHCYLTTTQPWNRVNPKFTYVNPFTGKPTFATITATQGAGNKLLPLVVASGQMYEGEPPPGPGAIRCVCFDKVRFFVRGFDRNGKMIQGREPGKAYVIELTDGENMTEKYMRSINTKGKPGQGKTPLRVIVVTDNKELPTLFKSWTTIAPASILAYLFLSMAVTIIALVRKKDKLKWYHYLSTSTAVIIAIGWFAIALQ